MTTMKWLVDELEAASQALDHYGTHDRGCPAVRGRSKPCGCGLYAAKTRLHAAVRRAKPPPDASPSEGGPART